MGFHEVRFPDGASYGSRGGPGFNTSILETQGGESFRVQRWTSAKRRFNGKYVIQDHDDAYAVLTFYLARGGPANGFRLKDWSDYATNSSGTTHNPGDAAVAHNDESIGTGDGSTQGFQLVKRYVSGTETVVRTIAKPVAGTIRASLDGVEKTDGVDFTVDTTTGVVTFGTAPGASVAVTAGCEFDVPVHFDGALDRALQSVMDDFDLENLPDIPMVEINNAITTPGEYYAGGGTAQSFSADVVLNFAMGRFVSLVPGAAGLKAFLPLRGDLPLGGPVFVLANDHAVNSLAIHNDAEGALLFTLTAGSVAWVYLYSASGTKTWKGIQ